MRRWRPGHALTLLVLWACAFAPTVSAQQVEASLSVLLYHPYPDATPPGLQPDPFGFPAVNASEGPRDWMSGTYGAYWFPTARFDGIRESSYARDGQIGSMQSFHDAYLQHYEARVAEDASFALRVNGTLDVSSGRGWVTAHVLDPVADVPSRSVVLRMVLFEDGVDFDGGNGVLHHRFVARAMLPAAEVVIERGANVRVDRAFDVPTSVRDPARLGVVAYVRNLDETATSVEPLEVLQSATYLFSQAEPTVQRTKSVLVEMSTATWCDSCVYGDGAIDRLANEYGVQGAHATLGGETAAWRYWHAPAWWQAGLAIAMGVVSTLTVVSRAREGGRGP